MSELTEIELNKLGDFKAHASFLKRQNQIAAKELGVTMALLKNVKEELQADIKKELEELNGLKKECESVKTWMDTEKSILSGEVAKFEADKIEFGILAEQTNRDFSIREAAINKEKADTEMYLIGLRAEIKKLEEDKNESLNEYDDIQLSITESNNILGNLSATISSRDKELTELEETKLNAIKVLEESISELEEEFTCIKKEVELESVKTMAAREGIEFREAELERKRKNMEIIYQRTRKAWEIIYPGQSLDNIVRI